MLPINLNVMEMFKCPNCEKVFKTNTWLNKHTEKKHSTIPDVQMQMYKCSYCKKKYRSKTWLIKHIAAKHKDTQKIHELQKENFRKRHVLGDTTSNRKRNTVCSELAGQRVTNIRKSGTIGVVQGRMEGEELFATATPVKHKGTGTEDFNQSGENVIIFLGVSDGPSVAGFHLAGLGDLDDDGHVTVGQEIFSQVEGSQSQTLNV